MATPLIVGRSVAVIVAGDAILLVESKSSPGTWVPPGGKIEARETADAAAARETLEEAGMRVEVERLIAYREVWWSSRDALELYFAARVVETPPAEAVARNDGRRVTWHDIHSLASLPHMPDQLGLLCELAVSPEAPPRYLGPADLRHRKG